MDFIGSKAGRRANGVIVDVFEVVEVAIPVVMVFVATMDRIWAIVHSMVDTCDATVATWVVGACREFVRT